MARARSESTASSSGEDSPVGAHTRSKRGKAYGRAGAQSKRVKVDKVDKAETRAAGTQSTSRAKWTTPDQQTMDAAVQRLKQKAVDEPQYRFKWEDVPTEAGPVFAAKYTVAQCMTRQKHQRDRRQKPASIAQGHLQPAGRPNQQLQQSIGHQQSFAQPQQSIGHQQSFAQHQQQIGHQQSFAQHQQQVGNQQLQQQLRQLQFDSSFGEQQLQFDSSFGAQQRQFESSFGQQRQFESSFGQQLQFEQEHGEQQFQFDSSFGAQQRQFESSFGHQLQFDSSFGQQLQFGSSFGAQQRQFESSFGHQLQFDSSFGQQLQFGSSLGEQQFQFDSSFGEQQLQFDSSFGAQQRQFESSFGQQLQFEQELGKQELQFESERGEQQLQLESSFGQQRLGQQPSYRQLQPPLDQSYFYIPDGTATGRHHPSAPNQKQEEGVVNANPVRPSGKRSRGFEKSLFAFCAIVFVAIALFATHSTAMPLGKLSKGVTARTNQPGKRGVGPAKTILKDDQPDRL